MLELLEIKILEPSTVLTDLILGAISIILSVKLFNKQINNWGIFLLFMGLSAVVGGFAHGFSYFYGIYFKIFSWILLNISVYFAEKDTIELLANKYKKSLSIISITKLIVFSVLAIYFQQFLYIKISAAVGVLGFTMILNIIKKFNTDRKYIVYGILISVISVIIHWKKIAISEQWFNHNDISHVITIISILFVFYGILKYNERKL